MIGKVKIGKSFAGICRYVLQEDKQAQVLAAEGVRTDSAAHMAQDFAFQQSQRPGLGNAVLHVALALPAEDAAGRSQEEVAELLRQIGREGAVADDHHLVGRARLGHGVGLEGAADVAGAVAVVDGHEQREPRRDAPQRLSEGHRNLARACR